MTPQPSAHAGEPSARSVIESFRTPPADSRPMMRWWWFGPDVDRGELARELRAMRDAGIGGVEVAFVYPLSRAEHPFLSPGFLDDVAFAARTARELGLRFDLTLGSGWSYGGGHIGSDTAARTLRWDVRDIGIDALDLSAESAHPDDLLVAVFIAEGTVHDRPVTFEQVPVLDGRVHIGSGRGPRQLAIAWSSPTGQQVKRAASGAEGPVLDHYSAEATAAHLAAVADPLLDAVPADLLGSVFCDSLEVYHANWTPRLPAEFVARRGRDLIPDLWRLRFDAPGSAEFRAEYYTTLGELYEENFLDVVRGWAKQRGVPFRVQSYGTPPARLGSYGHADLVEGEGWGWRGIPQTRWASSAAHHLGRSVVSSETWTWVHSPSFRGTPLDLKGEAHEHFLLGINQLIGHGWPYSAPDAPGLGWFFYASGALDDRNAWWPAMPRLTEYLARLSALLRQGSPVRDVLLYLPTSDVYPRLGPEKGGNLDLWRTLRAHIGDEIPAAIRDAGLDFDLVDDDALDVLSSGSASTGAASIDENTAIVLPFAEAIPERTRRALRAAERAGALVVSVGAPRSEARPHQAATGRGSDTADVVSPDELTTVLRLGRSPDLVLDPPTPQVGFVHREIGDGHAYLLVNTGPESVSFVAHPRELRDGWQLWRAEDGRVTDAGVPSAPPHVRLEAYQAVVIATDGIRDEGPRHSHEDVLRDAREAAHDPAHDTASPSAESTLSTGWRVSYHDRADASPVELPHDWRAERPGYAGSATYELEFDADSLWPDGVPSGVDLHLGDAVPEAPGDGRALPGASYHTRVKPPVCDVAQVELNGTACGTVFAPPYAVDVTDALVPGRNILRVTVSNSTAAALTDPDVRASVDDLVARSRELYGMRFVMQDLDAAGEGLRSGLVSVPRLRWTTER
ncbi:glycosyl hydrolase [Rathayibacter sp. CAU 1779]